MNHQQAFDEAADRFESIIPTKIQPQLAKVAALDAALSKIEVDDFSKSAADRVEILQKQVALLRSRREAREILVDAINQARAAFDDVSDTSVVRSMSAAMATIHDEITNLKAQVNGYLRPAFTVVGKNYDRSGHSTAVERLYRRF